MLKKSTFGLLGSSFSGGFFSHLLVFSILVAAVMVPALVIFPEQSYMISMELAGTESSPFYMVFTIILTAPRLLSIMAVSMVAAAIIFSPFAGGASAYLSDNAFKGRRCSLKDALRFALKNYGRLVGVYALYVLIILVSLGAFAVFMYFFMHEWSHVYMEKYLTPVFIGWAAGILIVFGGVIMSPLCSVYERRGGSAVGASFRMFFKGGFVHNAIQLFIGGAIWFGILFVPNYFVLSGLCEPGMPLESLLYSIDIPGGSILFWIVFILSFIFATMFMFIYTQAVYFGAKARLARRMRNSGR